MSGVQADIEAEKGVGEITRFVVFVHPASINTILRSEILTLN
ncbi:MAG TPA: hypothetical protein V6D11_16975 [Waterburya sp.]